MTILRRIDVELTAQASFLAKPMPGDRATFEQRLASVIQQRTMYETHVAVHQAQVVAFGKRGSSL